MIVQAQQGPIRAEESATPGFIRARSSEVSGLRLVRFSGVLRDQLGQPVAQAVGVKLAIYKDQEGGPPLWQETQNVQPDIQGNYTVLLGDTTGEGIPLELFSSDEPRWFGIQPLIPGSEEQPRLLLVSVPYARKAADADTLGGKPLSAFQLVDAVAGAGSKSVSSPRTAAHPSDDVTAQDAVGTSCHIAKFINSTPDLRDSVICEVNGNIGIGTTGPNKPLHIKGDSSINTAQLEIDGSGDTAKTYLGMFSGGAYWSAGGTYSGSWAADGTNAIPIILLSTGNAFSSIGFYTTPTNNSVPLERVRIDRNGNIGIGTSGPNRSKLNVKAANVAQTSNTFNVYIETSDVQAANVGGSVGLGGQVGGDSNAFGVISGRKENSIPGNYAGYLAFATPNGGAGMFERVRVDSSGNVGIGTTTPIARLQVAGDAIIDGNIAAKYQDVAEWVETREPLAAGMVVVIEPEHRGYVRSSSTAYDITVLGAVSRQPGLILGESGPNKVIVAQSGRVRIKVDAQYGPIRAGDLLVTSPTPGHAMRSEPVLIGGIAIHRPGTLLGKALEPLNEGTGEILVLLTLQ